VRSVPRAGAGDGGRTQRCPSCSGILSVGLFRRQIQKGGFRTQKDAVAGRDEERAQLRDGTFVSPSGQTLMGFLQDWLQARRSRVASSTWTEYERYIRLYISASPPAKLRLQDLRKRDIVHFYASLSGGKADGGRGLSGKTVHNVHLMLHKALADAVDLQLLGKNPADKAHALPRQRIEMRCWSREEVRDFLVHIRGDRLFALWQLALLFGLRRGELLGLQWRDLDLEGGRITIGRQYAKDGRRPALLPPKTAASSRTISIDCGTAESLGLHRLAQAQERLLLGIPLDEDSFVFCQPTGEPIDPDGLSQRPSVSSSRETSSRPTMNESEGEMGHENDDNDRVRQGQRPH
jgi:hypothetical protein